MKKIDASVTRREFIENTVKLMVSVSSISLVACGCRAEEQTKTELTVSGGKITIDLDKPVFRGLRQVGQGIYVDIPNSNKPLIVIRLQESEVRAFSSECPHAGFKVMLPSNDGVMMCSSGHGGRFDLAGEVLHGPPKTPLEEYTAVISGSEITIDYVV